MLDAMLYVMPLIIGAILEVMFGDPPGIPTPRSLAELVCAKLRDKNEGKVEAGKWTALIMAGALAAAALASALLYLIIPPLGAVLEGILCWWCFSARHVFDETMKIHDRLKEGYITDAKVQISMVSERDTSDLEEDGIVRAAVEAAAEGTAVEASAPLFWMMIGGAPLAVMYRAAQAAAHIFSSPTQPDNAADKAYRFMETAPAALAAQAAALTAGIVKLDSKTAQAILKRDGRKYRPFSAVHSAFAGALGVKLGGDISYGGEVIHRDMVGDEKTEIHFEDIQSSDKLLCAASGGMLLLSCIIRMILMAIVMYIGHKLFR